MTKLIVAVGAGLVLCAGVQLWAGPAAADPSFTPRKSRSWGEPQTLPAPKPYAPRTSAPPAPTTPAPRAPTAPFSTFAKPAAVPTPEPYRPYQDKTRSRPKSCDTSPVYLPPGQIDAYRAPGACILR